ncbi:hypothetical protein B0H17DRAFT_1212450 [Mycena rosella]|uniref:Uncharacterized protein n=1 Tax=Mycena rosella TaxID=1033263 RepID=A0AAD7CS94_MYCRO|nr:hypothetical protein B0H17DRAFT_1212450 [Mycena rosella]
MTAANSDDMKFPSSALHPLLAFMLLRALALISAIRIELEQTAFCRMALAWPRLESLTIIAARGLALLPFRALRVLAQHCPCLTRLNIDVDVSKAPEFRADVPPAARRAVFAAAHPWLSDHPVIAEFAARIPQYLDEEECDDNLVESGDN